MARMFSARNRKQDEAEAFLRNCTLPQMLLRQAETGPQGTPAIREKAYGIWHTLTWREYAERVADTAMGLKTLGLRRRETAGLIVENCSEWLFAELGAQSLGAVTVNLFSSAVADELSQVIQRIQASVIVAQDQEQVDKLLEVREKIPQVNRVVYVDPTGMNAYRDNPWLVSFRDLLEEGRKCREEHPGRFEKEVARGRQDDIAVMMLTSGTTGLSKLAMLSHGNFVHMGLQWLDSLPGEGAIDWVSLSPPAWIVDQMWGMGVSLVGGFTMNFPETAETVPEDLREIGPSVMITSSRFWEDLASRIRVRMADSSWIKRKAFQISERTGRAAEKARMRRGSVSPAWRAACAVAERIVFRPLLDRVGCSRIRSAFTGGHPISPDVIFFFRSIGLNLKQCYGLTEAGGIFQAQPDHSPKLDTVGLSLPGTEVKLSEDKEVLVQSKANFKGYFRDYKATEEAFADGWLKTGDAGMIDENGHLVIIGRKAEVIRDKGGNLFSPDFIETRLKFSPYIQEAVIFGEGRPYLTAFINIDMGNVGNWAEERMIPYTTYTDLSQQPKVEKMILGEVRRVNRELPGPMNIRKLVLLYKLLDADDEELTRTGKVRRHFVYGLYLDIIEAMYDNRQEIPVQGKVRYRDGRTGVIETTVRIHTVEE
ncbi:MAG TPA: AMP-binding protein [Syntrophales bacterium]|nr:AMP-binding protein [Syntrophales bacterium]